MNPRAFLAHIESDGRLLADRAALDTSADVPCCPGWSVADLVEHTGVIHRHKTLIIDNLLLENPPPPEPPESDLLGWYEHGLERLLAVLRAADPDREVFTWFAGDKTVRFWFRRMAHETLIHRVDAEQATSDVSPIDPDLAADGIDEVLTMYVGGYPDWGTFAPAENTAQIVCTDKPASWNIRFGRFAGSSPKTGKHHDLDAFVTTDSLPEAGTVVRGRAADIDLWLWGRGNIDRLQVSGDAGAADRLRAICADTMG